MDVKERKIYYFDSIYENQKRSSGPRIFKKFVEHYFERKGNKTVFPVNIVENAPIQDNSDDCGVFVCQNAEKLARKAFVNTKQEDIPHARKKMMKEIFLGKLIHTSGQSLT